MTGVQVVTMGDEADLDAMFTTLGSPTAQVLMAVSVVTVGVESVDDQGRVRRHVMDLMFTQGMSAFSIEDRALRLLGIRTSGWTWSARRTTVIDCSTDHPDVMTTFRWLEQHVMHEKVLVWIVVEGPRPARPRAGLCKRIVSVAPTVPADHARWPPTVITTSVHAQNDDHEHDSMQPPTVDELRAHFPTLRPEATLYSDTVLWPSDPMAETTGRRLSWEHWAVAGAPMDPPEITKLGLHSEIISSPLMSAPESLVLTVMTENAPAPHIFVHVQTLDEGLVTYLNQRRGPGRTYYLRRIRDVAWWDSMIAFLTQGRHKDEVGARGPLARLPLYARRVLSEFLGVDKRRVHLVEG